MVVPFVLVFVPPVFISIEQNLHIFEQKLAFLFEFGINFAFEYDFILSVTKITFPYCVFPYEAAHKSLASRYVIFM